MLKIILLVISALALARAQLPAIGWCPDLVPMTDFNMTKFMGNWFEVERSSQFPELGFRCAMVRYYKGSDNKWHVRNIVGRILGFQRIIEGEVILPSTKSEAGKINLRYTTTLSNSPSTFSVLGSDYDQYAVLYSCNNFGPAHTESLWIMTRNRLPSSETLQKAYAVLDAYKISKSYMITTDQTECKYTGVEDAGVTLAETGEQPEEPHVEEAPENLRSAIIPHDSEADDESQEISKPEETHAEPLNEKLLATSVKEEDDKLPLPSTVAAVVLKTAESAKEEEIKEEKKSEKTEEPTVILPKVEPVVLAVEPIKKPVTLLKEELSQDKKKNRKLSYVW
ncbi:hypothetical protein PV328_008967 [Microctonus aethiopoides]|uniref:Lipocalin/cytosolic fatty-acid binding domain-containing protein n=1 Tax=Microctonus aethiopoides TaxID=144406 RepID=A0AA39FKP3_9HYME|nr:hypothetical protein PV328_008967 [Microctonus aethiopoides]